MYNIYYRKSFNRLVFSLYQVLTVILDESDPVRDIINFMPSRNPHRATANGNILNGDIRNIHKTLPELRTLSAKTERQAEEKRKKPPNFKAIATGVMLTQKAQQNRKSRACVIL